MRKIYYLSTCSTCQKILRSLNLTDISLQDIKTDPLTEDQLIEMKDLAGSYLALFSKKSRQYRVLNLHERDLTQAEMKALILKEYTFLKRPVAIIEGIIYIGNHKDVVARLQEAMS